MVKDNKIFNIGVCDWTLNMVHDENVFEKAKALGFDGVQIAFDINNKNQSLVNEEIQERYKIKAAQCNTKICSCAAINFLQTPLAVSNDPVGIFSSYIKAMKNLGIETILLPFFGRGDINPRTTLVSSIVRRIRKTPPKDILRGKTIDILKSIAIGQKRHRSQ